MPFNKRLNLTDAAPFFRKAPQVKRDVSRMNSEDHMKSIKANNKKELFSILSGTEISVPARTEGRETEHCERWSICRFLATLATHKDIEFPVELLKRERPDFLLMQGGQCIGIEVTEITNSDYAKATTLPEANDEGSIIDPSLFKWNTPKRSLNELREIVSKKKLIGPGWEGDSVEMEYADAIYDVMSNKTVKLRSKTFDKFSDNWLLIYCNLTLPFLDIEKANRYFENRAESYWANDSFSNIYVERNDIFVCYSELGTDCIELVNLWDNG